MTTFQRLSPAIKIQRKNPPTMEVSTKESKLSLHPTESVKKEGTPSTPSDFNIDDLQIIYSSDTFIDDDESGKTHQIALDHLSHLLRDTESLFIHRVKDLSKLDLIQYPENEHSRTIGSYLIDRQDGHTVLIANQVDALFYDRGRVPIMYEVFNKNDHLLFTTDGRESRCGTMKIRIRGKGQIVRGSVEAAGICGFVINDLYTDQPYFVRIPCWVAFFTCFLFCCHPCLRITRKETKNGKDEVVATMSYKRSDVESGRKFCLHFLNDQMATDNKLFLLGASLAFFHIYFKRPGKALRCLLFFCLIITVSILLGTIISLFVTLRF